MEAIVYVAAAVSAAAAVVALVFANKTVSLLSLQTEAAKAQVEASRAQSRSSLVQAEASRSQSLTSTRALAVAYFDYEFATPIDHDDHAFKDVKRFRQHVRELRLKDRDYWKSFQHATLLEASHESSAIYRLSIELNRLGASTLLSHIVMRYVLMLQAVQVAQDWVMMDAFVRNASSGPSLDSRRFAFILAVTSARHLRQYWPELLDPDIEKILLSEQADRDFAWMFQKERQYMDPAVVDLISSQSQVSADGR